MADLVYRRGLQPRDARRPRRRGHLLDLSFTPWALDLLGNGCHDHGWTTEGLLHLAPVLMRSRSHRRPPSERAYPSHPRVGAVVGAGLRAGSKALK